MWPRLAKTLTTPESVYEFVSCVIARSGIAHEYNEEGILVLHPTTEALGAQQFVVPEHVPPAETADCIYGGVV